MLSEAVGCGFGNLSEEGITDKVQIVATTTIVGDVVGAIGGEGVDLQVLLPAGIDPHSFEVTPKDVAILNGADIVFINGLGLESFLNSIMESALNDAVVQSVSDGIAPIPAVGEGVDVDSDHDVDPHVYFDPLRVLVWVDNIEDTLVDLDPENGELYKENALKYRAQLTELDTWISQQVEKLPADNRIIVTDHESLGYLADRYQFRLLGTVIPGYSTLSEPSAQELAALLADIETLDVRAVFVAESTNDKLTEQIARDMEIQLVPIFTGSLSNVGGETSSYLDFMRWNVETIIQALK